MTQCELRLQRYQPKKNNNTAAADVGQQLGHLSTTIISKIQVRDKFQGILLL